MEEKEKGKEEINKDCMKSFSQERRIRNNSKGKYFLNHFKINSNKKNNIILNYKRATNRVQSTNITGNLNNNNIISSNNRLTISKNKFLLKSQKIEKPIIIKMEQQNNMSQLPLLPEGNVPDSPPRKYLLKCKKVKKPKNIKNSTNRSYYSVDKVKIKRTNKRNLKRDLDIIKMESQKSNSILNSKTKLNSNKKEKEKYAPIFSSNNFSLNLAKKRGASSHSVVVGKKRKLKTKFKGKTIINKSSLEIIKLIDDLKSDHNNNNVNEPENENDTLKDNTSTRNKRYDDEYYITKYNNKDSIRNENKIKICTEDIDNMENSDNININLNSNNNNNKLLSIGKQQKSQMYFYVYRFYSSNNIYFFIPNSKYGQIKYKFNSGKNNNRNFEIIEDFYLPQAFRPRMNKWPNMPECITGTCKNGGFALIKNFDNCNLIWKLVHPNKMKILIRNIHNNQKYNHFISTFHLGRKDNLYRHFKYYKRLFPQMFNYAPATYILPTDGPDFEVDYKKYKKALWIVKPVNLSRGRGIHLLKGESEFKYLYKKSTQLSMPQYLISRYIDRPHLLNNKKYDLRIYVLVASFTPLRIYLYNNGLVRFATEDYQKGDLDNVYIHLTNYSINKNNLKYKINNNIQKQQCEILPREETEGTEAEAGMEGDAYLEEGDENGDENLPDDNCNKWSLIEYRNHFTKLGQNKIMEMIWAQIEAIVTKTVISVSKEYYKNIYPSKLNNSFELYGFDILIDANFRAWLMEVNVNPSLHCTSPLDLSIKTDLISDIFNVVGVIPYNHNGNRSVYNYSMVNKKKEETINLDFNKYKLNKAVPQNGAKKPVKKEKEESNSSSKMTVKATILKNFEPENLEKKLPEYDEEYYKKIIEMFTEEKARANATDFNLIFPLKRNIKTYGEILIKDNAINDYNIVVWQHILTHE